MPCFNFIKNILQQQKINCCYIPRKRCRITEETLSNHSGKPCHISFIEGLKVFKSTNHKKIAPWFSLRSNSIELRFRSVRRGNF